jgi:hypothetical protein
MDTIQLTQALHNNWEYTEMVDFKDMERKPQPHTAPYNSAASRIGNYEQHADSLVTWQDLNFALLL